MGSILVDLQADIFRNQADRYTWYVRRICICWYVVYQQVNRMYTYLLVRYIPVYLVYDGRTSSYVVVVLYNQRFIVNMNLCVQYTTDGTSSSPLSSLFQISAV